MSQNSFESDISENEELSWISWFCSIEGHEFLLKVPPEYFNDPNNLINLDREICK
jgi:casein kinase II subunit beta